MHNKTLKPQTMSILMQAGQLSPPSELATASQPGDFYLSRPISSKMNASSTASGLKQRFLKKDTMGALNKLSQSHLGTSMKSTTKMNRTHKALL